MCKRINEILVIVEQKSFAMFYSLSMELVSTTFE